MNESNNRMNTVQLAAKLYDARDAMRSLFGEQYTAKINEHEQYIRNYMLNMNCDAMKATMGLVSMLQKRTTETEIQQALLFAAYVEMTEGYIATKALKLMR